MKNTRITTTKRTDNNSTSSKLTDSFLRQKQITKIAAMLVLVIGLMASAAMAQNKGDEGFAPVGIYTGMESAPGTLNLANSMCYGNSFVLVSFGEWETHHLTVSLNYSTNSFMANHYIVTGGSWSLVVIRDNQYAGTLYGKVETGSVQLMTDSDGKEVSKKVQAILLSTGGLGVFEGKHGENISGVYDMTTDLRSSQTTGSANFSF
jgi:hypothetical protein